MKTKTLMVNFGRALLLLGIAHACAGQTYSSPGYNFTTLAGAAAIGSTDGPGNVARFNFPTGIAVDAAGNAYVADNSNHTIRKITPAGVVSTLAGSAGYPVPASSTGDGVGSNARFSNPAGVVTDAVGNVFVAGGGDNAIRKITPAGLVTTVASGGPISAFSVPQGIAIDSTGNLYVADTYHLAIKKITPAGVVTTLAGGSYGSGDGSGPAAQFYNPRGIAVDSAGVVYVADTFNHIIRKITPAGDVTTIAGTAGSPGFADGTGATARFREPSGLAIDPAGNLYVADAGNSIIRKITPSGLVSTFAGAPLTIGHADGVGLVTARFFQPVGVALDPAGNLLVVDTQDQTIRKITPSGVVSTVAGLSPYQGFGSNDGVGTAARFNQPISVAVGPAGELYVADISNNTIRKISAGGVVSTFAGAAGVYGYVDGPAATARFSSPEAVTVDAGGNVFVVDQGNSVLRKITPAGVVSTFAGQPGVGTGSDGPPGTASFGYILGLAVHPNGGVVVTEQGRVRMVAPDGTVTSLAVPNPQPYSYFGGVVVDPAGNIYVLDVSNAYVLKITPSGTTSHFTPQFLQPYGLALDSSGNLFVTGRNDHLVWKWAADGTLSIVGGLFDARGSADGVGEAARFENPSGIAVDGAGNIYVTCSTFNSNSIRKGVLAGPAVITQQPQSQTVATGGTAQFSVTASGLPAPTYQWYFNGVIFNGATASTLTITNVQASDAGTYAVVVSNPLAASTSNPATLTVSSPSATPPPSSGSGGGGGGGAVSGWFLVALLLLAAARFVSRRDRPRDSIFLLSE